MLADETLIFRNGTWTRGGPMPAGGTSFAAVRSYGANVIGYFRVMLCILAAFLIGRAPWTSASLLFGCTLLDWIDGPVARRKNQCSIFGSGVDWFADMMSQLVTMAWLVMVRPAALPWISIGAG